MNEWQPMNTAPNGQQVELGRWEVWKGEYKWETREGTPFEKKFFGLIVFETYEARKYTHWRHLPEPPKPNQ